MLVRTFAAEGWDADLEWYVTLDGLPVHVWHEGGEECVLPCAEVVMSEATIGRVAEEGVVVLASVRGGGSGGVSAISVLTPLGGGSP